MLKPSNNGVGEGRSYLEEPPETPAHLFAVKAFKSAFFGTPARPTDDDLNRLQVQEDAVAGNHAEVKVDDKTSTVNRAIAQPNRKLPVRPTLDVLPSPAKGILLTPGTGTTRRKTVSFGQLTDLAEDAAKIEAGRVEGPMIARNISATNSSRMLQKTRRREASLRRTLFEVRNNSEPNISSSQAPSTRILESQPTVGEQRTDEQDTEDNDDITTDLKHPLSRSGQHWMNEYQRDHAKSKREMRELIKYSQTAKSYARKRDAEALELAEKLRKAELKVAEMETRVSGLASQLTKRGGRDDGLPPNQAELLNELATQTARALRYKEKAEKCKLAVQEHGAATMHDADASKNDTQPEPAQVPKESRPLEVGHEAQAQGSPSLQDEISNLRLAARSAESKVAALDRENMALKHTLARVKLEMKAYEIRHKAREERRKRKDEKAEAQKQALKKELAQCKYGYLQKPDTLAVVTSIGRVPEAARKMKTLKQHPVVDNLNSQYRNNVQDGQHTPGRTVKHPKAAMAQDRDLQDKPTTSMKQKDVRSSLLQDSLDIWTASVPAGRDADPVQSRVRVESTGENPVDIGNRGSVRCHPKTNEVGSVVQDECTEAVKADQEHQINRVMTDSAALKEHSQPLLMEEQLPLQLPLRTFRSGSRTNVLSRLPSSSRTSSLSERPPLPPDRVEAAKRRLERRNAEKLLGGGDGKENRTS